MEAVFNEFVSTVEGWQELLSFASSEDEDEIDLDPMGEGVVRA